MGRRGPLPAIDATRNWETAEYLEQILGPGFELMHTKRMGWLLRQLGDRVDIHGQLGMGYREVDSAPDGHLGALLLRHQERQRSKREEQ